jgi:hypothetical protein
MGAAGGRSRIGTSRPMKAPIILFFLIKILTIKADEVADCAGS